MRQCPTMENNSLDMKNGVGDGSSSSSVRGLSPRGSHSQRLHPQHQQQQFSSSAQQLQLQPTQQQQHPRPSSNNGAGMVAGAAAQHRMPSPGASMRVPPLMSAVSPMTAPVAQVAPVPRGFDHTHTQSMSQVLEMTYL